MMDLSRDAVTIMSELSMGVAMAVTTSVWARMVPRRTRPSAILDSNRERLVARVLEVSAATAREPLEFLSDSEAMAKDYIVRPQPH